MLSAFFATSQSIDARAGEASASPRSSRGCVASRSHNLKPSATRGLEACTVDSLIDHASAEPGTCTIAISFVKAKVAAGSRAPRVEDSEMLDRAICG